MFSVFLVAALLLIQHSPAQAAQTGPQKWEEVCASAEATVREGDLIFLDMPNILFRRVAMATQSWTSHVGIVFQEADGRWIVAEGVIPSSRETPLCSFLKKSSRYKFEVRRLNRALDISEIAKMRNTSDSLLGKAYDLGFNIDSKKMFCSKFVYLVYRSVGIEAGEIQSFQYLIAQNPQDSLTFWTFWFLGKIPSDRRTITPASQLHDSKFITVLRSN